MRALVFSAGGTFGAYQAGVWRALEQHGWRPQVVVGASIGALNAAAVARGCRGVRLAEWWRDSRSDIFGRSAMGLLGFGRRLEARLEELFAELPPGGPAASLLVTLTELPSTRIRVVADQAATPRRLAASCAVPLLTPPVRLDGRWYCDGGLFCRMPLALAAQQGADEIVAVDLLAAPPSHLLRLLANVAVRLRRTLLAADDLIECPNGPSLCLIAPRHRLGTLRDVFRWERVQIDRWIEAGYQDAAASSIIGSQGLP